jgi:tetratricopeptide (TPR) repeat protein
VTQVIPLEKALLNKDLFLVYLDALASQGQWSRIASLLQQGNLPLEDTYIDVFLSRAYLELGDPRTSDSYWRRAVTDASYNATQGFFLAGYAEKLGQMSRAEEMYGRLTQNPDTARPAYDGLLRLSLPKGTAATLAVLTEMHRRWPDDEAVSNDWAYLELLEKEHIAEARSLAEDLCAKTPGSLPHRTTLALAWLRSGQPVSALQVYDGLNIDWETASAPSEAVYAAVLNANGHPDEARRIAAETPRDQLRPEETELLQFAR